MRALLLGLLLLSLTDTARADDPPAPAASSIATPAPEPWDDGWRVTAGASIALGSYAVGVGLWVATFFADVEICNAVAGDVCGLWGTGIGGALFLAAQSALTPALLGWLSAEAGVPRDEGWTFAGAALAAGAGLLVTTGTILIALFETEVSTEHALGIGLTAGAVADVVVALLFHELSRPAPDGAVTWRPHLGGLVALW